MEESVFKEILVDLVDPSPFQHRRTFSKLRELGESIKRDGLVQPITVRTKENRFELIAGERRFRAAKEHAGLSKIMARIVYVDDHAARRMCATENMQRDDLSAIEEVEAKVEILDAEFGNDAEYVVLGETAGDRVRGLLGRLWTVKCHGKDKCSDEALKFDNKFVIKTEAVFSSLPKPVDWASFYNHDLGITSIPENIKQWAATNKLNKSQTKTLAKLAKESPEILEALEDTASEDGVITWRHADGTEVPLQEVSAKELKAATNPSIELTAHNHLALGTGENEWYTPPEYIASARRVLGGIDLDPASSDIANRVVAADQIFSKRDNGLERQWHGRVWMNPPYSQPEIAQFSEKLSAEWERQNIQSAIALTHNYTDTQWFHRMANACTAICFTRGRIGFKSPEGKTAAPTQGQTFFYFGNQPERFSEEFSKHGFVVEVCRGV
jgi:phage N-6-adenine-methyltransferase